MNDAASHRLKVLVERAVRPVLATMTRRRRMRDELLAHLTAVFEEEAAKSGDEQSALDRAAERFGDPVELGWDLQKSVPWWDSLLWMPDELLRAERFRPGESPWWRAWRIARLAAILLILMYLAIGGGVFSARRVLSATLDLARTISVVYAVIVGGSRLASALKIGIYRALKLRDKRRRRRLVWLYAAISLPGGPIVAFLLDFAVTGDFASSLSQCGRTWWLAPLVTLVLLVDARSMADPTCPNPDWPNLEIEE